MNTQIFADTNIAFMLMRDSKRQAKLCIAFIIIAILCVVFAVLLKNWGLLFSFAMCILLCRNASKASKDADLRAQDLSECNLSLSDDWLSVQQVAENGRYETINVRYEEVACVMEQYKRIGVPMFYVRIKDNDDKESQYFIDGVEQEKTKWSTVEIDGRNYETSEFRKFFLSFIEKLPPTSEIIRTEEQTSWFKKKSKASVILMILAAVAAPVLYHLLIAV